MKELIEKIYARINRPVNIMEVCGTHTVALFKHGIRSLLPEGVRLLSGPGCPVCVTSIRDVDTALAFARHPGVILATFGDMMRVPGGTKSLLEAKADGADIRIVYSPLDCLAIAKQNPAKKVVFFSAGFETTAPNAAATLSEAERLGVENFFLFSVHKVVPPALSALLQSDDVRIDAFMLPGHVSTIIGTRAYDFLAKDFRKPCVVTGFGAEDILAALVMILRQMDEGRADVEIQYASVVSREGNPKALRFMETYFEPCDSYWRGIGVLPGSGLCIREAFRHRDAVAAIPVEVADHPEPKGCMCGQVLRGIRTPNECRLFGTSCTPERPVGACMVSTEGSCAAYYRFAPPAQGR
ncbi:MAG: hydrogenase formation protein HypD [Nitrospiraceae bacterium]|jgi:hydrogenase expression/formation protein HypD|nr:hydrogenase formation protein HypD [Nitrospiraceae bacterium]